MSTSHDVDPVRDAFEHAGQGQVFRFADRLNEAQLASLVARAKTIDLEELSGLVKEHVHGEAHAAPDYDNLEPAPYIPLPRTAEQQEEWRAAEKAGAEAIRAGRVAAFTVAGGQGTRLGYDGPKGTFPVTPVTRKTLFQVFAEKIARTSERFDAEIHWFILTSEINDTATRAAFEENEYFGLSADRVHFIVQGLVPAVDREGKILMSSKYEPAMTPDGHGGSLRALVRSGATETMKKLGVDTIAYFQVDNPLVPCIDPAFIGFHLLNQSECSSKMIPKAYPLEKVGHFCTQNGKTVVIEYSDLPAAKQEERLPDGSLRFVAGSVAIHVFDRGFIERLGAADSSVNLPFHRADKKIPYVNEAGETVSPSEPNGIKFEMFVFDALPLAANPVIIEGERGEAFSPVKNAEGVDSPETCQRDQLRQWAGWLREAGVELAADKEGVPSVSFEISPRFAADKQDFLEQWSRLEPKPSLEEGVVIE